jgi:hypothetical protein
MKKIIFLLLVFSLSSFHLISCTMTHIKFESEEKHALYMLGGGSIGTLILGNLGGFIVGSFIADAGTLTFIEYEDQQVGSRKNGLKRYVLKDKRARLFIEGSSVEIKHVGNSSKVEAHIQYTLLAPSDIEEINIIEKRILSFANESLELDTREIIRKQGTYISTMKFKLPKDMPKGSYTLLTTVSDGKHKKTAKSIMNII